MDTARSTEPDAVARPPLQRISEQPLIRVADGFATARETATVVAIAARIERLQPSQIPIRLDSTGLSFEMPIAVHRALERLALDISAVAGVVNRYGNTFRFRRYGTGEWHPPHCDAYEIDGLHLVATAILYLTDAEGGETWFPDTLGGPLAIAPKSGRLAVWSNYLTDGSIDLRSRHEAKAVRAGHKSTITLFIYNSLDRVVGSVHSD